jgi:hypothetical protein
MLAAEKGAPGEHINQRRSPRNEHAPLAFMGDERELKIAMIMATRLTQILFLINMH